MKTNQAGIALEVCVDDLAGAYAAADAGANRIEYCEDLNVGGTTPALAEVALLSRTLVNADLQIMVRPRGGDFVHSQREIDLICTEIEAFRHLTPTHDIQIGFVFGTLNPDLTVNAAACKQIREAAGDRLLTFHRAIDSVPNWEEAIDALGEAGVNLILTTGKGVAPADEGQGYSTEGMIKLAQRGEKYGLGVLASGGLRPEKWDGGLLEAGFTQYHLRAPWTPEENGKQNSYGSPMRETSHGWTTTNPEIVAGFAGKLAG
ncbi:hypothetical protein BK816_08860 [Boudabousia tangfeifanii]|uniref:PF03932 family protein CutC n=1 Tax=Boudabousia tangfeifanii TaxID=1912795 RepID=A0A1D9MM36_9ACTO|nr:copper homeostasis protein CutC [Boudabousia tangfeifanii]AOZ73367.1 hypothetical protein BK816_08860 [Boudabousia tangfeifanii]